MGIGLTAVLPLGLLPALLAGLLVYNIIVFGGKELARVGLLPKAARIILLIVVFLVVISAFIVGGVKFASFISNDTEGLVVLLKHMADAVISSRQSMPEWIQSYLPSNIEEWQAEAREWLLANARHFSAVGRGAGLFFIHVVFGIVIGGIAGLHATDKLRDKPLIKALDDRAVSLNVAFRRIVFSQIKISAFNTVLTGIFLAIVMPAFGYHLPLVKTMIAVTFIVGLLPIIGNIISNIVIFLIALNVSLLAAIGALAYLIFIHQLEYFVNAKIIGPRINAGACEVLTAMIVMEAAFGVAGLIAAPIYYAYIKDELANKGLV